MEVRQNKTSNGRRKERFCNCTGIFGGQENRFVYCSPYKRSMDTIADAAAFFGKEIITDERLREREKGPEGNNHGMFQKRWADRCEDFLRIIDWMPYIIELDFEGDKLVGKHEYCYVEKEFKGNQRANKR